MKKTNLKVSLITAVSCLSLISVGYAAWIFGGAEDAGDGEFISVVVTQTSDSVGAVTVLDDLSDWYLQLDQGAISFKEKSGEVPAETDLAPDPYSITVGYNHTGVTETEISELTFTYTWALTDDLEGAANALADYIEFSLESESGTWDPTETGEGVIPLPTLSYTNEPGTAAELAAMLEAVSECKIYLLVSAAKSSE
ncbi:MAG TPA: hypothetical protein PKC96_07560 [Bacilli bacterium]|nr:hypothetical protein [Bacilli bacterium]